ncbi:hypothetical protein HUA78_44330 [Myxococcus sp. CA033]|uniref:hypothetical protein n=1 Tax=Myxococcus sp. CA033 TaxID=2741516 RepID=UPI00157B83A1|nr:hypothetical protein [Myxococcus sp. CA033]NTX41480.1 hypothetical protein [Myxococcus sp. CA033]
MRFMKSWRRLLMVGTLFVVCAPGCRPGPEEGDAPEAPRADLAHQSQEITCGSSQVPVMTSGTLPVGIVTRSGAFGPGYEAWLAFDEVDSSSSMWISGLQQSPAWIGYEWADGPRRIIRYAIRFSNGSLTSRAPKAWTLQGWNGSQWVVVDTRTNEVNWGGTERRVYTLAATATYPKFRLNVTDDNDSRAGIEVVSIGRLELLGCLPDTTPPTAPVLTHFTPAPPSTTSNPNLIGNAETGSTVRVYPNANCSGTPSVSVTAGTEQLFLAVVPVNPNATTVFTATATDSSGNVSACSQLLSYVHDSMAPAAPVMTGFQPVSPGNSLTPQARGTAEKGSTVQVFKGSGCVAPVVVSAVADASTGAFSASVTVTANTTTSFSARAVDLAGNVSACATAISYVQDSVAPAVPVLTGFQPVSPGNSLTPQVRGTAEKGGTVQVFKGSGCVAPVAVSAVADASTGAFSASVTVTANTVTDISARAMDPAGNVSACSTAISYRHDGIAPPAPRFMPGFIPVDGNATGGLVRAMGEVDSRVTLFMDAACATLFSPSGPFVVGVDGSVTMALTPGQRLGPLFADARDVVGNRSACVPVPVGCDMGFADCDGNPANGCEGDLLADEANCGACGTVCAGAPSARAVCGAGTCGLGCVVGTFDCDGSAANGCESPSACAPLACGVDISSELMITDLSVVDDPLRTTGDGVWTFGHLMREMNGGQDPSDLVRDWLSTWMSDQFIGATEVGARPNMAGMVLQPWENSSGPGPSLDFNVAPFRLLAIVNRMDLRKEGEFAGEGRFVFGVTDPNGHPLPFTVILEYILPGGSPDEFQRWARDWHELGRIGVGSPGYNEKLEALTSRFTKSFVARGAHLGSAIHQVRTNENALVPLWELREFHLGPGGLMPAHVALSPTLFWDGSRTLADYVNLNLSSILTETHTVPEFFENQPLLAGSAFTFPNFAWAVPQVSTEARHKFSLNTCSGCHGGETGTVFLHVHPRAEGVSSALSPFLVTSGPIPDRFDPSVTRTFADLVRRQADMTSLVCGVPVANPLARAMETLGTSMLSGSSESVRPAVPGFPPPSNLPAGRVH